VQGALAQLLAMAGSAERARETYARARDLLAELGQSVVSASSSIDSGPVEMLLEDLDTAEALLRRDYGDLETLGETYLRSTVGGLLSYVLALKGRLDESEAIAIAVRDMAGPDDFDAHILWRRALGRRRAAEGRFDEAVELASDAVALTGDAAPLMRAYALSDRAIVMGAAGRIAEAEADCAAALALHDAKGNRVAANAIRRLPLASETSWGAG
jgi:tetratricopeptide (TPR) repeat protein